MHRDHVVEQKQRNARLEAGIYGQVLPPIRLACAPAVHDVPSYQASCATVKSLPHKERRPFLDRRCFFTGTLCMLPTDPRVLKNRDPRLQPWIGSRDHLVPARRDVPGVPIDVSRFPSALVWTSLVANNTLGLAPLMVRLKIRQWLSTYPYDPCDDSVEAGQNMRWILIEMLNTFRHRGRYPWSRRPDGHWWDPAFSALFMQHMWQEEHRFLTLGASERNAYIAQFSWQF